MKRLDLPRITPQEPSLGLIRFSGGTDAFETGNGLPCIARLEGGSPARLSAIIS